MTVAETDTGPSTLPRFTAAERALHWAVAVLMLTCAGTGMILYFGALGGLVGQRVLVRDVHVVSGLALPLPFVAAYAGRWRAAVRRDVRILSRWSPADRRWIRSRGREATGEVGKFNAGQKLNAAFVAGVIPVMMGTGAIMRWHQPVPLAWRTGATFVHDWAAIAIWLVVAGHILMALSRPPAVRGIVAGSVPRAWAEDHYPRWAAELVLDERQETEQETATASRK